MTTRLCVVCLSPSADGYLCVVCVRHLCMTLCSVGRLVDELNITLSRRARMADPVGYVRRTRTNPMAPDWEASDALANLKATLTVSARRVAAQLGGAVDAADTSPSLARWLARRRDDIGRWHGAVELAYDITDAVHAGWATVDRSPDERYAGPCDCGADLYGVDGAAVVRCGQCHVDYPVTARRAWLLSEAMDLMRTPAEVARALPGLLGQKLTTAMVQGYVYRGDVPSELHADGHRRVRIGDIVELLRRVTSNGTS